MLAHSDRKLPRGSETQLGLKIIGEALVSDADAFCHLHQHERQARSSDERGRETAVADRRQPRGAGWRTSADNRSTLPTPTGGTPSRIPRRSASSDAEAPLGHGQADDELAHGRLRQAGRVCARNGGCGSAVMWGHFSAGSQHVRRALPPRPCATRPPHVVGARGRGSWRLPLQPKKGAGALTALTRRQAGASWS